jgi:NAD-dependent deacetylase
VQPAASVPLVTVRCGGKLVIVNKGETPLDHLADARHHDLVEVFERIAREV